MSDGSIIATIIIDHMPINAIAALIQLCPGIRIHAIDMVQPPGIGIALIVDIETQRKIVAAALQKKSSAAMAKKARSPVLCPNSSSRKIFPCVWATQFMIVPPLLLLLLTRCRDYLRVFILIVPTPPDARFVASARRPIEPLIHSP